MESDEDRGSTPLASSLRSQRRSERDCRAVASGIGGRFWFYNADVASYDSASEPGPAFTYVYILQKRYRARLAVVSFPEVKTQAALAVVHMFSLANWTGWLFIVLIK